ncbi:BlaI/MecI/CopY family transcriptional regulator [Candidatus Woesearchaeota archaeon]|nr:BlaI/MecI/CopY family transcriptional regulator [Candidatus Woesearchaeota archaeon]
MKDAVRAVKSNSDILSPLENDVISILWPDKSLRVREIHAKLKGKRNVAVSSVAVILDRLFLKGLVERNMETARGGVRYIYFPTKNRKEFEKSVVEDVVNGLINRFGSTAVSYFHERFRK